MPKIVKLIALWDTMGIYGSQWEIKDKLFKSDFVIKLSESCKPGFVSKF